MNKIEEIKTPTFMSDIFIQKINSISTKLEKEKSKYYIDSRILSETYLLYLEMLIFVLNGGFTENEEKTHFKKYFVLEKMRVIDKLLSGNLKVQM